MAYMLPSSPHPAPPFYPITYIGETYPERHYPLEQTRHKIGNAIFEYIGHPADEIREPLVDIRESRTKYYIDVELPGLGSVNDVEIGWVNSRMIVVRGKIGRHAVPEETAAKSSDTHTAPEHRKPKEDPVHYIKKERRIGLFNRAFEFRVDVDHETLKAHLQHGLLKMSIDKKHHKDWEILSKKVKVEQGPDDAVSAKP